MCEGEITTDTNEKGKEKMIQTHDMEIRIENTHTDQFVANFKRELQAAFPQRVVEVYPDLNYAGLEVSTENPDPNSAKEPRPERGALWQKIWEMYCRM